jgi:hypothetical protein
MLSMRRVELRAQGMYKGKGMADCCPQVEAKNENPFFLVLLLLACLP